MYIVLFVIVPVCTTVGLFNSLPDKSFDLIKAVKLTHHVHVPQVCIEYLRPISGIILLVCEMAICLSVSVSVPLTFQHNNYKLYC